MKLVAKNIAALTLLLFLSGVARADDWFGQGVAAYEAGKFPQAAENFRMAAAETRTAEAYYNLGNAEWQTIGTTNSDSAGPAILAWEQAKWLNPYDQSAAGNLRFARRARQLEAPDLAWYEICSTWLPVNAWPWLATISFWLAIALVMLPGIFGWRRTSLKQGIAAASFAVFLLTIPALIGVQARTHLGIVLSNDTPLRLTPTAEAQVLARLPAGTAARMEDWRGQYVFIRSGSSFGWLEKKQFTLIAR